MSELTCILDAIDQGRENAAEELLPLVYDELRRIAAYRMSSEAAGHTLQPTALVHEAWLRLVGAEGRRWQNRAHFFAAAAEAMRRILVEHARRKHAQKRHAGDHREDLDEAHLILVAPPEELLAVHETLDRLAREDATAAELVKLRYFVGMTMEETAAALGLTKRTAEGLWTYARAWLKREMRRT